LVKEKVREGSVTQRTFRPPKRSQTGKEQRTSLRKCNRRRHYHIDPGERSGREEKNDPEEVSYIRGEVLTNRRSATKKSWRGEADREQIKVYPEFFAEIGEKRPGK